VAFSVSNGPALVSAASADRSSAEVGTVVEADLPPHSYDVSTTDSGSYTQAEASVLAAVSGIPPVVGHIYDSPPKRVATNGAAADAAGNEIAVIGRQPDTAVAQDWAGHEVLNLPGNEWSIARNDEWVRGHGDVVGLAGASQGVVAASRAAVQPVWGPDGAADLDRAQDHARSGR
jgi:hypothetical protein